MLRTGACGDDCNCCPRYLATRTGEPGKLVEVALLWQKLGWRDSVESPDKIACNGCASVKNCGLGIKQCAREKELESCGQCREYPCEKLMTIFRNNQKEASLCRDKFSPDDYSLCHKAFFSKKERLDKIHREFLDNS